MTSLVRTDHVLRGVLLALVATPLSCGSGSSEHAAEDGASEDATSGDARPEASPSGGGAGDAAATDAAASDATVPVAMPEGSALDATQPPDSDAGAQDAPSGDGTGADTEDAPPGMDAASDSLGLSADGAVLCRLSSDCADVPATFCQKDSCDPNVVGTCAIIPGTRETGYRSPADGGGLVCGCNGQVYPYACIAHAQQVNVASQGACPLLQDGGSCATNADCPSSAFCEKSACDAGTGTCVGMPSFQACFNQIESADAAAYACGCDHVTYSADCEAQSSGINVDYEGVCPPPPSGPCTSQDDCGGSSYASLVFCRPTVCGQPAGVCTGVQGACPASSFGDNVCGCDGRNYINECMSTWQHAGIAYGGGCRDGGIVPCDGGSACAAGQACIPDPRVPCTGPSCPGVCVAGGGYGQGLEVDGGVFLACQSPYGVLLTTLDSRSACDGGPCTSCAFSTGTCAAADRGCVGNAYCTPTGCGSTTCTAWYCVETLPNCAVCAFRSNSTCDTNTPCPAGQLCIPATGCDGGTCPGVCVVP